MKDRKQRRTLSGAVLVMVLTVMFVLIILLMATLTVVTTANQRIYTKFEENQAYYTARSALDVYVSMLGDKTYETGADYDYGTSDTAKMKQGLALQLDLYALEAIDENGNSADLKGNLLQSDLSSNAPTNKREYKNYYGYKSGNKSITYEVEVPNIQNTSDPHSRYVKFADTDASSKQKIEITVQVLSREYSFGGDISTFNTNPATATSTDKQNLAKAMMDGDRTKDSMRLKITVNATLNNTVGTAVLICNARELPVKNDSKALTAFGSATLKNMNIVGGASSLLPVTWDNTGKIYGNIYDEQKWMYGSTGAVMYLTDNEYYYVGGNFENTSGGAPGSGAVKVTSYALSDPTDKNKRPYIYVGGIFQVENNMGGWDFSTNSGGDWGTVSNSCAVDLITHGLKNVANDFKYNGDIYCKGECDFTSSTNVDIKGDVFIDGKLKVNTGSGAWKYDTLNDKLNLPAGTKVYFSSGSKIEAGGTEYTLHFGNVSSYGYDSFASLGKGVNNLAFVKGDPTASPNPNPNDDLSTDFIEIKLPNGVEKSLSTREQNYGSFYKVDSTGKFVDASGNPSTNPADWVPVTAEEYAFTKKSDLAKGKYSNKEFNSTDIGTTKTLSCKVNNGGLEIDGVVAATGWDIDTNTMDTKYVLSGNCGSTQKYGAEGGDKTDYMYIHGGGTVDFLLQPGGTYWGNIVVADDTQLNIYAPVGTYTLEKFCVWSETIFNAYKNNSTLYVGYVQNGSNNIKVPKINYYFAGSSVVKTNNNFFLSGYIYAPDTVIQEIKQVITFNDVNFNGNGIGSQKLTFVGSALCKDFLYDNAQGGIAYINPNLASTPVKGDPPLRFESYHYERN